MQRRAEVKKIGKADGEIEWKYIFLRVKIRLTMQIP